MIISRTPFRISLGGGGTDLPSYYQHSGGGFLVAGAISRHVYVAVNQHFADDILLKYAQIERVSELDEIKHPLLREALRLTGILRRVEVSSMADLPAHTGLGSSGAFTVGVLKALHAHQHHVKTNLELAEEACRVEIDILGEPVGKQDQYIAAVGGVTSFEFRSDGSVEIIPIPMTYETRDRLEENLLLFFTGIHRSTSKVLADQDQKSQKQDVVMMDNLDTVKRIGRDSYDSLVKGDLEWFAALMTEQWELKRARSPSSVTDEIDLLIKHGLGSGASGAKLVGAGGGGFLLFYSENKAGLRAAMSDSGLPEVRFGFDYEGSKLIVG